MTDWLQRLTAECQLDASALRALQEDGFTVIEGPVPTARLDELAAVYDNAMEMATEPDKRVGRTTTRVRDLPNQGDAFDCVYLYRPVLAACCYTIRQPFKLSSLLGRTLHARSDTDDLHVDFARDDEGWPMLGFILMIDPFTSENGATRFWPGSHRRSIVEPRSIPDSELVSACGPRGAVVLYNGSVCHGHGPNHTDRPRRSIQGAYIRRSAAGFGLASRMNSQARERIGPLANYLISV
jgi:hypothetical protein